MSRHFRNSQPTPIPDKCGQEACFMMRPVGACAICSFRAFRCCSRHVRPARSACGGRRVRRGVAPCRRTGFVRHGVTDPTCPWGGFGGGRWGAPGWWSPALCASQHGGSQQGRSARGDHVCAACSIAQMAAAPCAPRLHLDNSARCRRSHDVHHRPPCPSGPRVLPKRCKRPRPTRPGRSRRASWWTTRLPGRRAPDRFCCTLRIVANCRDDARPVQRDEQLHLSPVGRVDFHLPSSVLRAVVVRRARMAMTSASPGI